MNSQRSGRTGPLQVLLLALLGAGLNHTAVVGGINLSIADAALPLVVFTLAVQQSIQFPPSIVIVFLLGSVFLLLNSVLITPLLVTIDVDLLSVLANYLKLAMCFGYLLLGYTLTASNRVLIVIRSFVAVSVSTAVIAVCDMLVPSLPVPDYFYYAGIRFSGLMNDPNYYSVTQLAALAILVRTTRVRLRWKVPLVAVLVGSLLASGSKTGFLSLVLLLVWWVACWTLRRDRTGQLNFRRLTTAFFVVLGSAIIFVQLFDEGNRRLIAQAIAPIPAVNRLAPLLLDFESGIQADGSSRGSAWAVAGEVIGVAPLSGIGVGTYLPVSEAVTGHSVLAHNSFLQLAAEWGIPLTLAFMGSVMTLVFVRNRYGTSYSDFRLRRDTAVVLLVGSLGISLNNSRLFWFILGCLLAGYILRHRADERSTIRAHHTRGCRWGSGRSGASIAG